jgi:hypothetical protein
LINDDKRVEINNQNPFFEDVYSLINNIITVDGMRFAEFKDKINSELPTTLEGYDKYLKQNII